MFFSVKEQNIFDAHEYYLSGDYEDAMYLCEQILAVNPESYSALNIIANIHFIQGDFDKGEAYIYKIRDLFMRKKEYDKAVAVLHRLVSFFPDETKYLKDIADIYLKKGSNYRYFRQRLEIADIYKRHGRFKKSADIYLDLAEFVCRPGLLLELVDKLNIISATDHVGILADKYIFGNPNFSDEKQDDVLILCSHNGCRPELFVKHIPALLSRDAGWIDFVEKDIIQYFTENKNDELYHEIMKTVDYPEEIINVIKENAPEHIPADVSEVVENETVEAVEELSVTEEVIPAEESAQAEEVVFDSVSEDEPEEASYELPALELDSHVAEEPISVQQVVPLELDSYNDGAETSNVSLDIDGLEKFETDDTPVQTESIALDSPLDFTISVAEVAEIPQSEPAEEAELEMSFTTLEPEEAPVEDVFASFETTTVSAAKDDIFAAFDNPVQSEESAPVEETAQISFDNEPMPQKENVDMFEDLIEVKQEEEPVKEVEQIDMSDVMTSESTVEDIFEKEL